MSWDGTRSKRRGEICQFLKEIEDEFKHVKFFHSQQKTILEEQYIPIRVTLGREYRPSRGHADLESSYTIKELSDAEYRIKQQVPWKEVREQRGRIMVLADPGMGKSTLLKMEASSTARSERQKLLKNEKSVDDLIFPIVLKLYELDAKQEEISQAVPTLISRDHPETSEELIHLLVRKLNEGKCLLLLDALDEVPDDHRNDLSEKLNEFARDHPCPIICTSRTVGYAGSFLDGAEEVEIAPFSRDQVEQYIQKWFTNAAGSINSELVSADGFARELLDKPGIQGLVQIPLLLSLLCSLYQEKDLALPARRCQIYGKALEYMLSKWSQNRRPQSEGKIAAAKIRLLEEPAYYFTCEGKAVFSPDDLHDRIEEYLRGGVGSQTPRKENHRDTAEDDETRNRGRMSAESPYSPEREEVPVDLRSSTISELIMELSEKDGIIQLEKSGERYTFLHWSFQEYLTACYLNRSKNGIDLAREHFWEYDWHGILSLLAGLMEDPVPLIQAIADESDDIFSSLLLLAGRCIAECEENPHPLISETIDRIYKLWRNYPSVDFISSVVRSLGRANSQMSARLREALNDQYTEIREAATKVLAEIGGQQVIEPLIQALKDEDSDARWRAAEALAEISSEQVVEPLNQALKDEGSGVRRYAVWALGRIGGQRVVEPLIRALNDEDSSVRYYAAWALGEVICRLPRARRPEICRQAIEPLIQALKGEDSDVRGAAANALSRIGSHQAIEPLIRALNDQDSNVRWVAAEVLGKMSGEQAIKALIQALNDQDSNVREAAVEALGEVGSEQAIEPLIQTLKGKDSSIGRAAAKALGEIGFFRGMGDCPYIRRAIEPLIQELDNEDSDVREAAAEALGKIGGEQAIEPLIQVLGDQDSFVRGMAAEALGKIGSERAIKPLIQALNDEYSDVRWAAARALGEIGSEQAIEPLIKTFKDEHSDVREAAARGLGEIGGRKAVNTLIQALNDESRFVRREAAVALGEIGSEQAVEPLIHALNHKDSKVRHEAAVALGKISSQKAAGSSTYVINPRRRYIREAAAVASSKIGSQQLVDALTRALNDEDSDVRYYTIRALGEIGSEQAIEPLIHALKDDDVYFRRSAAEVLSRIGTLVTLEKILQFPIMDVYDPDIFSTARTLAVRFSKEETPLIPVYPELIVRAAGERS